MDLILDPTVLQTDPIVLEISASLYQCHTSRECDILSGSLLAGVSPVDEIASLCASSLHVLTYSKS